MVKSAAERAREYRARKRGREPYAPKPCGTRAAAARHRRNGEPVCNACVEAEREYMRAKQRQRRVPETRNSPDPA